MSQWFALFMLIFEILAGTVALAAPLNVWIDPGHGGKDHGAVTSHANESTITLSVSRKLYGFLKKDRRFNPSLTRTDDVFVPLPERARLAKPGLADLFISIHVNASTDPRAHGAEFYFQNQLPPDEESMYLAHKENMSSQDENYKPAPYEFLAKNTYPAEVAAIVSDLLDSHRVQRSSELSRALKLSWRGSRKSRTNSIQQAPFFVLSQMRVPSTLVELGYLTNPEDQAELIDDSRQSRMAEDLYRGLVAYKDSMDKTQTKP